MGGCLLITRLSGICSFNTEIPWTRRVRDGHGNPIGRDAIGLWIMRSYGIWCWLGLPAEVEKQSLAADEIGLDAN